MNYRYEKDDKELVKDGFIVDEYDSEENNSMNDSDDGIDKRQILKDNKSLNDK